MSEFKAAVTGESEAQFRQFLAQLFAQGSFMQARTGIIGATGLGVTQTSTASASVLVDLGMGVVQTSTTLGAMPLINNAQKTLDVLTVNPLGGVKRNDIVVFDSATNSITLIVGTPNAIPTDPTVPATALPLARLRHDPGVSSTTVPTSQIDSLRVWTAMRGGITTVNDQADRDTLFARAGTAAYRQDTDAIEVYDGTAWQTLALSSTAKAGKRMHWGVKTQNTAASGLMTVTHGAGFTPTAVTVTPSNVGYQFKVDAIGATTFQVQWLVDNSTAAPSGASMTFSYFCGE